MSVQAERMEWGVIDCHKTALQWRIEHLTAENDRLKERLKVACESLEFYSTVSVSVGGLYSFQYSVSGDIDFSKRAREALEQIGRE